MLLFFKSAVPVKSASEYVALLVYSNTKIISLYTLKRMYSWKQISLCINLCISEITQVNVRQQMHCSVCDRYIDILFKFNFFNLDSIFSFFSQQVRWCDWVCYHPNHRINCYYQRWCHAFNSFMFWGLIVFQEIKICL